MRWRQAVAAEGRILPQRHDPDQQPKSYTLPCMVDLARFELASDEGRPSPVGSVAEIVARHGISRSGAYRVLRGGLHRGWFDAVYADVERGGTGHIEDW